MVKGRDKSPISQVSTMFSRLCPPERTGANIYRIKMDNGPSKCVCVCVRGGGGLTLRGRQAVVRCTAT